MLVLQLRRGRVWASESRSYGRTTRTPPTTTMARRRLVHETKSLPHDSASRGKSLAMAPRHWPMPRAASLMCVKMKMHIRACLLAVRGLLGMFGEVKGHPREKSNLKDNSPKQTRPRGGRGFIAFATQKELLRQYRPSHLTLWRGGSGWAWTTGHPLSGAASCPLLHSSMHSGCG